MTNHFAQPLTHFIAETVPTDVANVTVLTCVNCGFTNVHYDLVQARAGMDQHWSDYHQEVTQ